MAATKPPPLPTREEIEQLDTLVELHARLALHGADFPGRRKAPLRNRLLELLEEEEAAERRRFAEEEREVRSLESPPSAEPFLIHDVSQMLQKHVSTNFERLGKAKKTRKIFDRKAKTGV